MIRSLRPVSGLLAAAVVFVSVLAGEGRAMAGGDAASGHVIAQTWCASCHVVERGQERAQSDAPPFASIVRRALDPSAEWIAFRLLSPHPQMPQVSLTRAQAEDLAAYFRTLEKEQ
ncbi:c-type cytochrome [Xanthobacter sediminis]|uniref:c-type cytochrome n=1 Tax=Xanthobacter sediminis TaxID=3119926 RepID=UPI00372A2D47